MNKLELFMKNRRTLHGQYYQEFVTINNKIEHDSVIKYTKSCGKY